MATAHMPEEFFDAVAHHLPPEQPVGPKGGRPRVGHRTVIRVIWFVLATGCRWEDVPPELGCSGRTAHRRLRAWEEAGIWDRLHADLLRLLKRAGKLDPDLVIVDGVTVRAFGGGEATGPSPVDRRKNGTKHTLLVDRQGCRWRSARPGPTPATTRRSSRWCWTSRKVGGKPGRPKELPDEVYADRGYDSEAPEGVAALAGDRAAHRQAEDAARQRPGQGPLGGGADDQLAQGAAAAASAL